MSYVGKQDENATDGLFNNRGVMPALAVAMAMATTVVAAEVTEEDGIFTQEQGYETVADDGDARALQNMAHRAGITLTPATIKHMLEVYPELLDIAGSGERGAIFQEAVAVYPARFEVTGRAKIYEDTSLTQKTAGGRFAATGIDVLLNYSSVLGGISYENMALWGTSGNREIEAKLAVDAEFAAYGVYGRADAGPPPFPAVTYGVYGTTNQPTGFGGYFVNTHDVNVIGAVNTSTALYVKSDGASAGSRGDPAHYTAVIETTNTSNAKALAVFLNNDDANDADTYIGFITENRAGDASRLAGQIRGISGVSENGVQFVSNAADFAEFLPRANPAESIDAGDIVGVEKGRISRDLSGAHNIQVVSTMPIVVGNMPSPDKEHLYEQVAFLGQAPVKVVGKVKAGDYIVASGKNNGIGMAVFPNNMTPELYRMAVGRAWEASDEPGIKLVNTAVGLAASDAYTYMHQQDQRIASLEKRLSSKMARLDRLAAQMEALTQKVAYIQSANLVAKTSTK